MSFTAIVDSMISAYAGMGNPHESYYGQRPKVICTSPMEAGPRLGRLYGMIPWPSVQPEVKDLLPKRYTMDELREGSEPINIRPRQNYIAPGYTRYWKDGYPFPIHAPRPIRPITWASLDSIQAFRPVLPLDLEQTMDAIGSRPPRAHQANDPDENDFSPTPISDDEQPATPEGPGLLIPAPYPRISRELLGILHYKPENNPSQAFVTASVPRDGQVTVEKSGSDRLRGWDRPRALAPPALITQAEGPVDLVDDIILTSPGEPPVAPSHPLRNKVLARLSFLGPPGLSVEMTSPALPPIPPSPVPTAWRQQLLLGILNGGRG